MPVVEEKNNLGRETMNLAEFGYLPGSLEEREWSGMPVNYYAFKETLLNGSKH